MAEFNALSVVMQQKVIDNNRDINVDYPEWHDPIIEEWKERLESIGFHDVEISYSGFCSQGDGASFTSGEIEVEKVLRHLRVFSKYRRYVPNDNCDYWVKVIRTDSRYYHENSVRVDDYIHYTGTQNQLDKVYEIINLISEFVHEKSKEIYRNLNTEYDYLTSDDAVRDALLANEYQFDVDTGKII